MNEQTKKAFADRLAAVRILRLKAKRESADITMTLPDISETKRLKTQIPSSCALEHTSVCNEPCTERTEAISRQFDALQRGTLRWKLEKALENGRIDEAERLSDAIQRTEFLERHPPPISSSAQSDAGKNKQTPPKKTHKATLEVYTKAILGIQRKYVNQRALNVYCGHQIMDVYA
uniref:Uncharacterized protein n=1 Tax=Schistocephalus solidus TaxID=70667 RepID=A0A0X3P4U0_SCHSO